MLTSYIFSMFSLCLTRPMWLLSELALRLPNRQCTKSSDGQRSHYLLIFACSSSVAEPNCLWQNLALNVKDQKTHSYGEKRPMGTNAVSLRKCKKYINILNLNKNNFQRKERGFSYANIV